jgi:UDP-N-acetylglucosamine--N-acetylmuramyl-(pentapeptide) pyrophosphoryl-undecaprenol N-acetylglucosamine transferase
MHKDKIKIIISGGGSGGHIFPAIAIANAMKKQSPDADILFVGAQGKIEMEKVPAAGYKIKGLWISGFQRKLTFRNILFPIKLISSLIKAGRIIKGFKPDVVIGVGGFASGAVLKVATKMKIPTLIQEQNSFPGITNRLLANKVNRICVAYDDMEKYFPKDKIVKTGNPVRQDIIDLTGKREQAIKHFGLSEDKKIVLVVGGSLGARTINESIHNALPFLSEKGIQIIWQTGKNYYAVAHEAVGIYSDKGVKAYRFINEIDYAYAVADIVVSRAGAIAISELCIAGKPAILVPSPNVAEDHQTKNAMALVSKNAALLVKDIDAKDLLGQSIFDLLNNKEKQDELKKNISNLAIRDSAERIAVEIINLV